MLCAAENLNIKIIHRIIRMEVLVSKALPNKLAVILSEIYTIMESFRKNVIHFCFKI